MTGYVEVSVIGNLGRDPEKRFAQDGQAVLKFSVAGTTRKREPQGDEWVWADHTDWYSVTLFGGRAESMGEILGKGSRVFVQGPLTLRTYTRNDGTVGYALDVVARNIINLTPRRDDAGEYSEYAESEQHEHAQPQRQRAPSSGKPAATGRQATTADNGRRAPAANSAEVEDLEDLPF
jgi:single-strand DNA-binding protein